jgi:hypothetical protein
LLRAPSGETMDAKGAPGRLGVPDPRQLSPMDLVPARVRRPTPGLVDGGEAFGPSRPRSAPRSLLVAVRAVAASGECELLQVPLHVFLDPGDHHSALALGFDPESVADLELRRFEGRQRDRQLVVR